MQGVISKSFDVNIKLDYLSVGNWIAVYEQLIASPSPPKPPHSLPLSITHRQAVRIRDKGYHFSGQDLF